MEEANARQLVSRARKHIADGRCTSVSSNEQRRFLEAFIAAAQKGDMAGLESVFEEDIVSCSDGGGRARAARVPGSGRKRAATFIAAGSAHFWKGATLAFIENNGQAGLLMSRDGAPVSLAIVDASGKGIPQIVWIMRPSKLAAISKSVRQAGYPPGPAAA